MGPLKNELVSVMESTKLPSSATSISDCSSGNSAGPDFLCFSQLCEQVREGWADAVFSDATDEALSRYFNYHFDLLRDLLSNSQLTATEISQLLALMDHLLLFFKKYLDWERLLPAAYLSFKFSDIKEQQSSIKNVLNRFPVDDALRKCLKKYFSGILDAIMGGCLSLGEFIFANKLLNELAVKLKMSGKEGINQSISEVLIHLNFNHLDFFVYLKNRTNAELAAFAEPERIQVLKQKAAEIQLNGSSLRCIYDQNLAPILVMLKGWMTEEAVLMEAALEKNKVSIPDAWPGKVGLRLSVPQLACLIHVFYEAGIYATSNLTQIFKSAAFNYSTIKQENISPDSLSKELYGITQNTAKKVMELLLQMAEFIKLSYFPVVAVISVTILCR
ncbi:hypothetical protein ABID99_003531 [Mucilaginibacter sp. OAE612]|uniref:hypothetical protein n=1 Tax=Mucilaginibacter sp. OAE612 TaxID=3156444 RepID=UPI00359EDD6D